MSNEIEVIVTGPPECYHFRPFSHRLTGSLVLLVGWRLSESGQWKIFAVDNAGRMVTTTWTNFLKSYACASDKVADLSVFKGAINEKA